MIPPEEMEAARADMGELQFAQEHLAQFVTAGAGLFKPEWMEHHYDRVGKDHFRLPGGGDLVHHQRLYRFAVVDLAVSTRTTADFTVILSCGRARDGRLLILEVDRKRREGPDLVPAVQAAVRRWDLNVVWIERTSFQLAIVQEARRAGVPVRELQPDRDKVSRAMPATAAMEGGRVLLPRSATWLRDFETEVLSFPVGAHDDQVDCLSYAVAVQTKGGGSSVFLAPIRSQSPDLVDRAPPGSTAAHLEEFRRDCLPNELGLGIESLGLPSGSCFRLPLTHLDADW